MARKLELDKPFFILTAEDPKETWEKCLCQEIQCNTEDTFVGLITQEGRAIASTIWHVFVDYEYQPDEQEPNTDSLVFTLQEILKWRRKRVLRYINYN